jgi:hypothetical protein
MILCVNIPNVTGIVIHAIVMIIVVIRILVTFPFVMIS